MLPINILEIISVFIVLFSIIDVTGAVPIFLNLKSQGRTIHPEKAAFYSFIVLTVLLYESPGYYLRIPEKTKKSYRWSG